MAKRKTVAENMRDELDEMHDALASGRTWTGDQAGPNDRPVPFVDLDSSAPQVDPLDLARADEDGMTNQGAPVPAPISPSGQDQAPHPLIPGRNVPLSACPTNLPLGEPRGKALLFNAIGEPSLTLTAGNPVEMNLRYYLVHRAQANLSTMPDLCDAPRTVLIDNIGRSVAVVSWQLPRRLQALIDIYGSGPWEDGVPIMVVMRRENRRAQPTYDILIRIPAGEAS